MRKLLAIWMIALLGSACGDFLEEDSQTLSYVNSVEDLDELLVGSGYLQNATGTYYTMMWLSVMDDDVCQAIYGSPSTSSVFNYLRDFYRWSEYPYDDDHPTTHGGNLTWKRLYESVGIANLILGDIERFQDEEDYSRVKGEAYFIRAYSYFYLVNLWGHPYEAATAKEKPGVPIKLTDYVEDIGFARNTVEECYQQIVSDAKEAIHYLKGITPTTTFRAGENAARALLAKTALYMGDWETVVNQCDSILTSPKGLALYDFNTTSLADYATKSSFNAYIRSNTSTEAIFSGGFSTTGVFTTSGTASLKEVFVVSNDLIALYDQDKDLRFKAGGNGYFFVYYTRHASYGHYRLSSASRIPSNSLLFSEVYLNKAEALAALGRETEAIETLQELRRRRMTDAGTITATGEGLMQFIRDERRRELSGAGQRWFDLRRYAVHPIYPEKRTIEHEYYEWDNNQAVLTRTYVLGTYPEDGGWLLPIPTYAMESNDGALVDNERPSRD